MRRGAAPGDRGGFALAMVVLLLFAVGVAAATAYQVVRVEAELAVGNQEASDALDVANAGLQRYLAESLGMPDTVAYAVGGGTATVYPRRLVSDVDGDSYTDLYIIRAEGEVADARYPDSPAKRVVSEYAYLHRDPVSRKAALQSAYPYLSVGYYGSLNGNDEGGSSCSYASEDIYGLVKSGSSSPSGTVSGSPSGYLNLSNNAAVIDTAGVRWDILQDPDQPVGPYDLEANWPSFGSLPSDSFPVVRASGSFSGSFYSGKGVLIVPGTFSVGYGYFQWKGIIMAGSIGSLNGYYPSTIEGIIVGGLDGGGSTGVTVGYTTIRYNRCYAIRADQNLSYLEPLSATWWAGL